MAAFVGKIDFIRFLGNRNVVTIINNFFEEEEVIKYSSCSHSSLKLPIKQAKLLYELILQLNFSPTKVICFFNKL